eukprot:TRINITY_DN11982_c0_g1_i3.p2 TRINITY_DN11982_c0_g1~~TRINITY_DN11982_c0_g1_i3.p2  ORF type:complete len:385 (+),score=40.88 TRINITY_DN11982_c0_g1_i3:3407-4561(+)
MSAAASSDSASEASLAMRGAGSLAGKSFYHARDGRAHWNTFNKKENDKLMCVCWHDGRYYGSFFGCEYLYFPIEDVNPAYQQAAQRSSNKWVYVGGLKGAAKPRLQERVDSTSPLKPMAQRVCNKPATDCIPAALYNVGAITHPEYDTWLKWQCDAARRHAHAGAFLPIGFAVQALSSIGRHTIYSRSRGDDVNMRNLMLVVEDSHVFAIDAEDNILYDSANSGAVRLDAVTSAVVDAYTDSTDWHFYQLVPNPTTSKRKAKRAKLARKVRSTEPALAESLEAAFSWGAFRRVPAAKSSGCASCSKHFNSHRMLDALLQSHCRVCSFNSVDLHQQTQVQTNGKKTERLKLQLNFLDFIACRWQAPAPTCTWFWLSQKLTFWPRI